MPVSLTADLRAASPAALQADLDPALRRGELDGVGEQVPDHLLQAVGSPETGAGRRSRTMSRRISLASAAGRTVSSAASMMRRRSTGLTSRRSLPVMMRETSRRSAMIWLLDSAEPVPVSGDPDRLQQVVWNLLSNAVKFTPAGGRVEVALERAGAHVDASA